MLRRKIKKRLKRKKEGLNLMSVLMMSSCGGGGSKSSVIEKELKFEGEADLQVEENAVEIIGTLEVLGLKEEELSYSVSDRDKFEIGVIGGGIIIE